jgi:hypothetical protein
MWARQDSRKKRKSQDFLCDSSKNGSRNSGWKPLPFDEGGFPEGRVF